MLGGGSLNCEIQPRTCRKAFGAMIFKGSGPARPWHVAEMRQRKRPLISGHQLNENVRIAV
eukprot:5828915-Amphidinium_carterae.1